MLHTCVLAELIPNKLPDPGPLYSGPIPTNLTSLYQVNFRDQHFSIRFQPAASVSDVLAGMFR
jgi:hypothetical protein